MRQALRYRKGVSVPKDEGKALEYFKRACDGGDKTACGELAK
jgi:TPR repeat protein